MKMQQPDIEKFLKTRISVELYFKFFYEKPIDKPIGFSSVQLPYVKRMFS